MTEASGRAACPICRRPAGDPATAPFCGPRCAAVDLGRWLQGAYRVPAAGPTEGAEAEWPPEA